MLSERNLPHTNSTEKLIRMMDRFFYCLNVTRYTNHSKKPELEPYKFADDWRFDVSTLIIFFQTLNISHLVYYKSHITDYLKILSTLIIFFQTLNISHLVHYKSHITNYLKILFCLIS